MKIAIIDADLIGRKKHRFPNLACMKLSAYYKEKGNQVVLKLNYDDLDDFDLITVSKVFTDTPVPEHLLKRENVIFGGTGFYYDKAPKLDYEIEHHMPDYHLYDEWVKMKIAEGTKPKELAYYTDYSIGFLTRGCFRKCPFCVNKNYSRVSVHSPLQEFLDDTRPKICLLDDNFMGCPNWKDMLLELQATKKPFIFKQGLDERILTDEKCELLFKSKYDGDYIFAFDNLADRDLIERKLQLIRKYTNKIPKFYCFTGFDRNDQWNDEFWKQDIFDLMERVKILMQYRCLPYVMRFNRYEESPYRGFYITVARWANQPSFFKKKSLREFAISNGTTSACFKYTDSFEKENPDISDYLDMRFPDESL